MQTNRSTNAPYSPVVLTSLHEAGMNHRLATFFILFAAILAFSCLFAIPLLGL